VPIFALPFPVIDPVAIELGPLTVHWYALAYVVGLLGGWAYACVLVRSDSLWLDTPRPTSESLVDLLLYIMLGTIIGGRLGQVILYEPGYYMAHPIEIFEVWHGGMAFHGGLIGVLLAIWYFVHRYKFSFLTISDICAVTSPITIFLVRVGNFINSEHWGRRTNVPWAVVFPDVDAHARHPSQLYEAILEGLLPLVVLGVIAQKGGFRRLGLLTGLATLGYALARTATEFFREPDPEIEQLPYGLTMGMILSAPMVVIGTALIIRSALHVRRPRVD